MTLIVGMYYNNKKGALIASDSRVVEGYEVIEQSEKIINLEKVLIALSGTVSFSDDIIEELTTSLKNLEGSKEIKAAIQKAYTNIRTVYLEGEKPLVTEKEFDCSGMFGFYEDKPKLFEIDEKGVITQAYNDFIINGQEESYVKGILRKLYKKESSEQHAIRSIIYSLLEVSQFNVGVDNNIQIATINKEGIRVLNYNQEGEFIFQKPEFEKIKKSVRSAIEFQRIAFNILVNGKRADKNRLEKLLKEIQ